MVKSVAFACLVAALGIGIALPLVWPDQSAPKPRHFSVSEVEARFAGRSFGPLGPPDNVTCSPAGSTEYDCEISYIRKGSYSGYDVTVDAYEPPPRKREVELTLDLMLAYMQRCHGKPGAIRVRCDQAAQRCNYRIGDSGGSIGYNDEPEGMYC